MRQQCGNLGQEGIAQDCCDLFVAAAAGIADQLAHFNAKRIRQTLQRSQRGYRLAVLNFGDVSAGHLHAPCKLPLTQVPRPTHLSHLPGHLQASLVAFRYRLAGHQLWRKERGFFHVQCPVAPSAKRVAGPVLDQPAIFVRATHNFACFHAYWRCSHWPYAERQSRPSGMHNCTANGATLIEVNHNCQVEI